MLSIIKMSSANYYLLLVAEDYYLRGGEGHSEICLA
jgi:hypothetical protein